MQSKLERSDHRGPNRTGSVAALWVGLGAVLGVLGAQLWPTSTHAPATLQAMAPMAIGRVSLPMKVQQVAAPQQATAVDPNDRETTERSVASYDR